VRRSMPGMTALIQHALARLLLLLRIDISAGVFTSFSPK